MGFLVGTIASLLAPYASNVVESILGQVSERLFGTEATLFLSEVLGGGDEEEEET